MSLAPLHPIRDYHSYVRGDVLIDPSVAIAPGVLLQAEADSQIAIAPGACIGMGSIIHAIKGRIEIGEGAILGAGVLVIGNVSIGANACIGSATTIFNTEIAAGQILPPGALVGDESRQVDLEPASVSPSPDLSPQPQPVIPVPATKSIPEPEISDQSKSEQSKTESPQKNKTQVYGKTYISQLLVTMLPHRQPLNPSTTDE